MTQLTSTIDSQINNYTRMGPRAPVFSSDILTLYRVVGDINTIVLGPEAEVYVETNGDDNTAIVGNINRPFATIAAAIEALPAEGGVVKIGVGEFLSPDKDSIKDNTKLFGSGRPRPNFTYTYTAVGVKPTITSPTKMIGGTILLGTFNGSLKDGIELHNLGVDCGLDYCNTYTAGVAQEGVLFAQFYDPDGGQPSQDGMHALQSTSPPRKGIVISNVSALCKSSTSLVHAMLLENTINAQVSNVFTTYGIHGLVVKSIGATVSGLIALGHQANGLIVKANDYAYGQSNNISNIYISSIGTFDGGGLMLVGATGATLIGTNISNLRIEYTTFGIGNDGPIDGISFSNIKLSDISQVGISLGSDCTFLSISNADIRSSVFGMVIVQASPSQALLSNITTVSNSVYGVDLRATGTAKITVSNIASVNDTANQYLGNIYEATTELIGV